MDKEGPVLTSTHNTSLLFLLPLGRHLCIIRPSKKVKSIQKLNLMSLHHNPHTQGLSLNVSMIITSVTTACITLTHNLSFLLQRQLEKEKQKPLQKPVDFYEPNRNLGRFLQVQNKRVLFPVYPPFVWYPDFGNRISGKAAVWKKWPLISVLT